MDAALTDSIDRRIAQVLAAGGWRSSLDPRSPIVPLDGRFAFDLAEGWSAVLDVSMGPGYQSRDPHLKRSAAIVHCIGSYTCPGAERLLVAVNAPSWNVSIEWDEPDSLAPLADAVVEDAGRLNDALAQIERYANEGVLPWAQSAAALDEWVAVQEGCVAQFGDDVALQMLAVQIAVGTEAAAEKELEAARHAQLSDEQRRSLDLLAGFVAGERTIPSPASSAARSGHAVDRPMVPNKMDVLLDAGVPRSIARFLSSRFRYGT